MFSGTITSLSSYPAMTRLVASVLFCSTALVFHYFTQKYLVLWYIFLTFERGSFWCSKKSWHWLGGLLSGALSFLYPAAPRTVTPTEPISWSFLCPCALGGVVLFYLNSVQWRCKEKKMATILIRKIASTK